jgi:hypothetical protein
MLCAPPCTIVGGGAPSQAAGLLIVREPVVSLGGDAPHLAVLL